MKRLVKLVVSAIYAAAASFRRRRSHFVVLYYHAVPAEQRAAFARQMDLLLRIARPVRADFSGPLEPGRPCVAVTFDDAFRSAATHAIPETTKRGIPVTVFVPSGWLGRSPGWIRQPCPLLTETVLTAEEMRQVDNALVTWGSHGVTHADFTRLAEDEVEHELAESKAALGATLFSFPFGAFDARSVEHARRCGYRRVFTTLPRTCRGAANDFCVGRVSVEPTDWPIEFRLKALGAYSWLPAAFALKRAFRRRTGP